MPPVNSHEIGNVNVVIEAGIETPKEFFSAGATETSWTGDFTYKNQDRYSGALISRDGKMVRQGYGTCTHMRIDNTVEVYEGEFQDDRRDGFGVYTYANGDTEQGQWVGGVPHGTTKKRKGKEIQREREREQIRHSSFA